MKLPASKGANFRPAEIGKGARFELKEAAIHLEDHLYFKTDDDATKMDMEALMKARRK